MKKKKLSFPSALTVLFIVLIFAAILTAVVPAGLYSKLAYNAQSNMFEITDSVGKITEMEPTQETLDELGVTGNLDKFLDGTISKPVAIPGTYEKVEQNPQGIFQILLAPISGVYDSIDIILFIFVLGGCIGVLNYMGAFNSAIAVLSKITKGKEYLLIILITIIIAAGGTTFGLAEETIALYPILVPVFLAAGYDVMGMYCGNLYGIVYRNDVPDHQSVFRGKCIECGGYQLGGWNGNPLCSTGDRPDHYARIYFTLCKESQSRSVTIDLLRSVRIPYEKIWPSGGSAQVYRTDETDFGCFRNYLCGSCLGSGNKAVVV